MEKWRFISFEKSIDSSQPAQSAQADLNRYFLLLIDSVRAEGLFCLSIHLVDGQDVLLLLATQSKIITTLMKKALECIFSFFHSVFYSIKEGNSHFSNLYFVFCKCFQFCHVQNFCSKELKNHTVCDDLFDLICLRDAFDHLLSEY